MTNEQKAAVSSADALLLEILRSQPQLLVHAPGAVGESKGRETGALIAALRNRLIEMYRQTPR